MTFAPTEEVSAETFAERVGFVRSLTLQNRRDFSLMIGKDETAISRLERGRVRWAYFTYASRIANAAGELLNIDPNELMAFFVTGDRRTVYQSLADAPKGRGGGANIAKTAEVPSHNAWSGQTSSEQEELVA